MGKCINLSHPEFKNLVETSGLDPLILASKIKTYWEKTNNTDIFPTLEELGLNTIKPGVSELFEQNPELATIGTQEQYSQYLDTIFPDSQVKDIVYHGTPYKFDNFNKEFKKVEEREIPNTAKAYFFTQDLKRVKDYGENIKNVLLNINNPLNFRTVNRDEARLISDITKEKAINYAYKNIDSVIANYQFYIDYIVFEPEQIHILGNKQDIQGFKDFVSKNNQEGIFLQKKSSQTKADDIDKSLFNVLKHYNISTNGFMSPTIWADKLRQDLKKAGFDSDRVRIKQTENKSYFVTVNKGDRWKFFKPGDFFFYQIKESKLRKERNKELDIAMQKFFETFGFQYESVSQIEFNGEVLDNIALANTLTKVVQVIEGKTTIDTLPEEAAHIFVELMGEEHPMIKRMLEIAPTLPIFEEVYNDYYDIYNGDQLKLAKETVGKVIAQHIVGTYTGDSVTEQTAKTWWQAIWAWITNRFRPNNPFKQAASEILNTALRQIPKEQVEPVSMEETTKEVKPSFTKIDYTGNNMSELKGANDEIFYNFEQYFPNYSYLTTAERVTFVELVNDGKIQISCKI